ncbi:replication initiation protein [Haliovirga abyssi]|uniref:Initiator Rep protein domain-containing protein n=1 Tax=Haliovirga abyssi TaxID=2996794 RepID=A0AAU9D6R4_9FUSO|nr:replication initiation protein [Haliovirga abyssi]BDU51664.1 hypothetical protein HLVA_22330 [Haliovirga abyssi]
MAILKKSRILIQSSSKMGLNQKKAFNALLYIAKQQMDEDFDRKIFKSTYKEVKSLMTDKRINNNELLKNLESLVEIGITINILENEKFMSRRAVAVLAEVETDKDFNIEFIFPDTVRKNLYHPKMFSPLNLDFQKGMSRKHSLPIYEFCKDYIKVQIPKMELETFKFMLGITGAYNKIHDLRRKVIEPAIKEINETTDINITKYELIRNGKKMGHIKFWGEAKEGFSVSEGNGIFPGNEVEIFEEEPKGKIKIQKTLEFEELIKKIPAKEKLTLKQEKELKKLIKEYGLEHVESNLNYTNSHKYKEYYNYLRKAIKEDYAEPMRVKAAAEKERLEKEKLELDKQKAAAELKAKLREETLKFYNNMPEKERLDIEKTALEELEQLKGIKFLKNRPTIFASMKEEKIIEILSSIHQNGYNKKGLKSEATD